MISCEIDGRAWSEILGEIEGTLEKLELMNVGIGSFLPRSLPRLETLIVKDPSDLQLDRSFADTLVACGKLKRLHLSIDNKYATDEEALRDLARFVADRESTFDISHVLPLAMAVMNPSSHFLSVSALGDYGYLFHDVCDRLESAIGDSFGTRYGHFSEFAKTWRCSAKFSYKSRSWTDETNWAGATSVFRR